MKKSKRQTVIIKRILKCHCYKNICGEKKYAGNVLGLDRGGAYINTIHTESFTLKWSILTYCTAHGLLLSVMGSLDGMGVWGRMGIYMYG